MLDPEDYLSKLGLGCIVEMYPAGFHGVSRAVFGAFHPSIPTRLVWQNRIGFCPVISVHLVRSWFDDLQESNLSRWKALRPHFATASIGRSWHSKQAAMRGEPSVLALVRPYLQPHRVHHLAQSGAYTTRPAARLKG